MHRPPAGITPATKTLSDTCFAVEHDVYKLILGEIDHLRKDFGDLLPLNFGVFS